MARLASTLYSRVLVLGLVAAAGCQSLLNESLVSPVPAPRAIPDDLREQLSRDCWQFNSEWSPLDGLASSQEHPTLHCRFRWVYAATQPTLDATALQSLAERDEMAGWNALILWSQRDPTAVASAVDRLEQLVRAALAAGEARNGGESGDVSSALVSPSMQCAAVEAWCLVLGHTAASESIEEREMALAPAGRLLLRPDLPPAVRGELFRGCARWIPPDRIPRLADALTTTDEGESAPIEIRRAAIESCVLFALENGGAMSRVGVGSSEIHFSRHAQIEEVKPAAAKNEFLKTRPLQPNVPQSENRAAEFDPMQWPQTIRHCAADPDAHVRRLFGQWLAVARPPDAVQLLTRQLDDNDPCVRDEAFLNLGWLGNAEAHAELRSQVSRSQPRVRALAVKGLAYWGTSELARSVNDPAFEVRQAVAQELARFAEASSAVLLQRLLADPSAQVQQAAVDATLVWPDDLAIPVLLQGILDSTLANRTRCRELLERRIQVPISVTLEASRDQRMTEIVELAQTMSLPRGVFAPLQEETTARTRTMSQQRKDEIEAWLTELTSHPWESDAAQVAWQRLRHLSPSEIVLVEEYAGGCSGEAADTLHRHVLPELSPAYAALTALQSSDVKARRRAAQDLAQLGSSVSLSPFAVRRLCQLMANEQDGLVWRFAMNSVIQDDTEEAAQLALLAANHAWPDIRILGCRYIARHGHPQYAHWLLPLLAEPNREVLLEAVRAAGLCRNPVVLDGRVAYDSERAGDSPSGLRPMLTHADPQVRLAVAVSMSRLGDAQGMQELMRLSYHGDPKVRIEVVKEIGETGQSRFIEHLIRLAWTEAHNHVKVAILGSLDVLVPTGERPPELATACGENERIQAWVSWWERRRVSDRVVLRDGKDET